MNNELRVLQSIQLKMGNNGPIMDLPANQIPQDGTEVLQLPHFPFSTLSWLGAFGQTAWQRHQVCCALLLLVNPERMSWGITVPIQTPRRDGVAWRQVDGVPKGEIDTSKLLVGGSFQTSTLTTPDDAADLVPASDGFHLISPTNIEPAGTWCFLRVAGELDVIDPQSLVTDDWGLRIEQVMRYLNLPE